MAKFSVRGQQWLLDDNLGCRNCRLELRDLKRPWKGLRATWLLDQRHMPSPVSRVEVRSALGETDAGIWSASESASTFPIPQGKIPAIFQDIPDVQFCNTILGILDPKGPLLETWRTLTVCCKLWKIAFFCESWATSLSAICKVLGNVRLPYSEEPGLVLKSTSPLTTVLTATLCCKSSSWAFYRTDNAGETHPWMTGTDVPLIAAP